MKLLQVLLLVLCLGVSVHSGLGQSTRNPGSRHQVGLYVGYGTQTGLGVPYHYKVQLIVLQYSYRLINRHGGSVEIVGQPQVNRTRYKEVNQINIIREGYEAGLNGGLMFRKHLLQNRLSAYALISAGPHYTSGTPQRQAAGFLFSDNIHFGISLQSDFGVSFDLRAGFRHLSNAGIQLPNAGVNNLVASLGVTYNL